MRKFLNELKNRNVYKVATAYLASSWLLIQVVSSVGSSFSLTESQKILIYKILIIGFPISLILAWLYELTPQGWKRTGTIQKQSTENQIAGKKLNRYIIAVLAIVLVFMLADRFFLSGATRFKDQDKPTLAILPFENLSSKSNYDHIGLGLAIELRDILTRHKELFVISESSSSIFPPNLSSIGEVADALEINYALQGAIRIEEEKMVINAMLTNTKNGIILWSGIYEENLEDILGVQKKIASKVVRELEGKSNLSLFQSQEKTETINAEAYNKYLRAKTLIRYRANKDSLELGVKFLEESLEEYSDFAESQALMAIMIHYLAVYGGQNDPRTYDQRIARMQEYIDNAKRINPEIKEVYLAEGIISGRKEARDSLEARAQLDKRIKYFSKALSLDPGYTLASNWLYLILKRAGRMEEALEVVQKAYAKDPLNPILVTSWANALIKQDDYKRALNAVDRVISYYPNSGIERFKAKLLREHLGDQQGALKFFYPYYKNDKDNILNLEEILNIVNLLDIPPLADKLYRRLVFLRGNDTEDAFWTILFHNYRYERYQENLDIFEMHETMVNHPGASAMAVRHRAFTYHALGDFERTQRILEEAYPSLKSSEEGTREFGINYWDRMWIAYVYSDLQRRNGNTELANFYADIACDLTLYLENPEEEDLIERARCDAVRGNTEAMYDKLEEVYLEGSSDDLLFIKGIGFSSYALEPRFIELTSTVKKRILTKRVEAISFLKEQGEWDKSWDLELGIK